MRDEQQVNSAIDKYGDTVRRICFLYLKSDVDAQDIFQDVFLKFLLYNGEFDSDEHLKAWLIRVSINRCKDILRGFFRTKSVPLDDVNQSELALPQQYSDVYDAVLSLPVKYKSIVFLFYYEGYSVVEIAKVLGKKENTVYTWLARARALLREQLGGADIGE